MFKSRTAFFSLLTIALLCLSLNTTYAQTPPVWTKSKVKSGISYFLRSSPAQIMRYRLSTEEWLSPLSLDGIPTGFEVDQSHVYVSFGRSVKRMALDGTSLEHITNTPTDIVDIMSDGNILFLNRSQGLYARITTINKSTLQVIDEWQNYIESLGGAVISASNNRIVGRSQGVSPSDITFADYDNNGFMTAGGDSPYHGQYPSASRVWIFPNESKVVDSSGTVYNTADLTFNNSFGTQLEDLDFYATEIPIALTDGSLVSFSNTLLETGRYELVNDVIDIAVQGENIYGFFEDSSQFNEVNVEIIGVNEVSPNPPGVPISPIGLAYEITDIEIDDQGILYLLNKTHASIFRWDVNDQNYLDTISLPRGSDKIEYDQSTNTLYAYSAPQTIYKIDLSSAEQTAEPFVNTPLQIDTMISLEGDLLVLQNGSWDDQWVYDSDGNLLVTPVDCCYSDYHFYNEPNNRLYVERGWRQYFGNGNFGPETGSANNNYQPLAISPNSQRIVDVNGSIYDANSLAEIDYLSNDITTAQWANDNVLFTVEDLGYQLNAIQTNFQIWNQNYVTTATSVVDGSIAGLLEYSGLVVGITEFEGFPDFRVYDQNLNIIPPAVLEAPSLSIVAHSAFAAQLDWLNVHGEQFYDLERRTNGATWALIAVLGNGVTTYFDEGLLTGNQYEYRVRSRNGNVVSEFSNIMAVDLDFTPLAGPDPSLFSSVPDDTYMGSDGRLIAVSYSDRAVYTWDMETQSWRQSIGLISQPVSTVYSVHNNVLFTYYQNGEVYAMTMASDEPVEVLFTLLQDGFCGMVSAGRYLIICDLLGAWNSHHSFSPSGINLSSEEWRYSIPVAIWSTANNAYYHFRDGSSPNDLIRTDVSTDGLIGNDQDSPYHSSVGIEYPIRVKPDGSVVILGSGRIYNAQTLEHIDDLPASIEDLIWFEGDLYSSTGSNVSLHIEPSFQTETVAQMEGQVHRLFMHDGRLFVTYVTGTNEYRVSLFDQDISLLEPPLFMDGFE